VGQSVIAIGTPLSLSMINSASRGIVSGTGVNIGNQYLFTQSDVSINGGNSGGPLINLSGELVGINSIKYTGSNIEGMSFSIPVDTINYVISSFETYGKVLRPNIGVTLTESWESKLGLPTKKGLSVSASQNPLLLSGDSVTKVNGIDVHSIADYNEVLKKTYTGGSVTFTYLRNNVEGTAEIEPLSD
jgi:serine protease Do